MYNMTKSSLFGELFQRAGSSLFVCNAKQIRGLCQCSGHLIESFPVLIRSFRNKCWKNWPRSRHKWWSVRRARCTAVGIAASTSGFQMLMSLSETDLMVLYTQGYPTNHPAAVLICSLLRSMVGGGALLASRKLLLSPTLYFHTGLLSRGFWVESIPKNTVGPFWTHKTCLNNPGA